jgi:hypothetical protein
MWGLIKGHSYCPKEGTYTSVVPASDCTGLQWYTEPPSRSPCIDRRWGLRSVSDSDHLTARFLASRVWSKIPNPPHNLALRWLAGLKGQVADSFVAKSGHAKWRNCSILWFQRRSFLISWISHLKWKAFRTHLVLNPLVKMDFQKVLEFLWVFGNLPSLAHSVIIMNFFSSLFWTSFRKNSGQFRASN